MPVFIELLDSKKRPFYDRNGVIKCDNRLAIATSLQKEAARQKAKEKRRACFMQVLIGKSPDVAKPILSPVQI